MELLSVETIDDNTTKFKARIVCADTEKILRESKKTYISFYEAQGGAEWLLNRFTMKDLVESGCNNVIATVSENLA